MNAFYIVETVTAPGRADSVRIDWVVAYGRYLAWSASDTNLGFFDSLDAARARAQAQIEADIALRSAASARAANALRAGIAALGLDTTVRFL